MFWTDSFMEVTQPESRLSGVKMLGPDGGSDHCPGTLIWENGKKIGSCADRFTRSKFQNYLIHSGAIMVIHPVSCLSFLRTLWIMEIGRKAYINPSVLGMSKQFVRVWAYAKCLTLVWNKLQIHLWESVFAENPLYAWVFEEPLVVFTETAAKLVCQNVLKTEKL